MSHCYFKPEHLSTPVRLHLAACHRAAHSTVSMVARCLPRHRITDECASLAQRSDALAPAVATAVARVDALCARFDPSTSAHAHSAHALRLIKSFSTFVELLRLLLIPPHADPSLVDRCILTRVCSPSAPIRPNSLAPLHRGASFSLLTPDPPMTCTQRVWRGAVPRQVGSTRQPPLEHAIFVSGAPCSARGRAAAAHAAAAVPHRRARAKRRRLGRRRRVQVGLMDGSLTHSG